MKTHWLLSLTVVTFLFACSKSDELPDPTPEPSKEEVDLTTLKVGQRSLFVRYTTTCENLEADFAFTGDTLIWEVVSTIEGDLQLKESFTERSPLYLNGAQEPVIYPVTGDGKKVLLPQRELSNLFFFYANDTIFLQPAASVPLQQDACRLMLQSEPFIDGVMFMHSDRLQRMREVLDDGHTIGNIKRIASQFSFLAPEDFLTGNIRVSSELEPLGCLGDLGWYTIRFSLWA
ncbi:MAG: hypothetical protein KDC30_06610, partial [Saprospiraceae bacterium]|nr:hypothetical protein [Saprospiraceae bacterium]